MPHPEPSSPSEPRPTGVLVTGILGAVVSVVAVTVAALDAVLPLSVPNRVVILLVAPAAVLLLSASQWMHSWLIRREVARATDAAVQPVLTALEDMWTALEDMHERGSPQVTGRDSMPRIPRVRSTGA